ncbi:MAG TPA: TRAP transporter small permease subunit [Alphaproteobacteria bacterium]|nr:TRAP transporter small permease subunit [Alphaproteobacteria bacterium]
MLDRVIDFLAVVAGVILCGLIALICADVTARNFKLFAIPWSLESAQIALYCMTFLAAPWVLKNGGHIAVDLLVQNLSGPKAQRVGRLTSMIGALVCGVLTYYAARVFLVFAIDGQTVQGAMIYPRWLVYIPAPPTFFLMFLIFARWTIDPARMTEARLDKSEGL